MRSVKSSIPGAGHPPESVETAIAVHVAERPDTIALGFGNERVTYAALLGRSDRLASRLRRRGLGSESVVAVCAPRSPRMVTAWLAALRAGAAYLPLDPSLPEARLRWMVEDSGAALVVTDADLRARFHGGPAPLLVLDDDAGTGDAGAPEPPLEPPPEWPAESTAYVIYTSGSTGRPKGVAVPRHALARLARWHRRRFAIGPGVRASQVAAPGFDAAAWEVWPNLAAGAEMRIAPEAVRADPPALRRWLLAERVEVAFLPTPLAEAVVELEVAGVAASAHPADRGRPPAPGARVWPSLRAGQQLRSHRGDRRGDLGSRRAGRPGEPGPRYGGRRRRNPPVGGRRPAGGRR